MQRYHAFRKNGKHVCLMTKIIRQGMRRLWFSFPPSKKLPSKGRLRSGFDGLWQSSCGTETCPSPIASPTVSVVIPTLNAESEIGGIIGSLKRQSWVPDEILVIDSSSEDKTVAVASGYDGVRTLVIPRNEFNHGKTRDAAVGQTSGDFICFLTQDALPASEQYLQTLIGPMLSDPRIGMTSGRQLAKAGARPFERLVRQYSYPAADYIRGKERVSLDGIRAYFASNCCSAYRRSDYCKTKGFTECDICEDMLMAMQLIEAGFKVAYVADACVYHSHDYTLKKQYERNWRIGFFLEQHREQLQGVSEVGMGLDLVRKVSAELIRQGLICEFFAFVLNCCARFLGNRAGRLAARQAKR